MNPRFLPLFLGNPFLAFVGDGRQGRDRMVGGPPRRKQASTGRTAGDGSVERVNEKDNGAAPPCRQESAGYLGQGPRGRRGWRVASRPGPTWQGFRSNRSLLRHKRRLLMMVEALLASIATAGLSGPSAAWLGSRSRRDYDAYISICVRRARSFVLSLQIYPVSCVI